MQKQFSVTYNLRLSDCRLGLLINFGEELIKNGISRVVNGLQETKPHAKAQSSQRED